MALACKFRWLALCNKPTRADVEAYRGKNGVSAMEALRILKDSRALVLQQWNEAEDYYHPDYIAAGGYWVDIETQCLTHAQYEAEPK